MKSSVITFPGSNCDRDMDVALKKFGFTNKMVWHDDNELPNSDLVDENLKRLNDFLLGLFRGVGIKLVDFKVEFGFTHESGKNHIILADEISPDTCRLWDSITDKKLDKDRFRKDLGDLIPAYTEVAKRLGILHEQSNVSAVNVTKLSSVKKKSK